MDLVSQALTKNYLGKWRGGIGGGGTACQMGSLLIESKHKDLNIPNFEQFRAVINGIAYYFIPPSVLSTYNPMYGMKDILDYGGFAVRFPKN